MADMPEGDSSMDVKRLTKWRLRLARLKLFNVFSDGFWLLPARGMSRWVKVRVGALHYLELSAVSEDRFTHRDAVRLDVRFFSILGREILPAKPKSSAEYGLQTAYFFADKALDADPDPQRIYIKAPRGAVFAAITLSRSSVKQRALIQTDFCLKPNRDAEKYTLAEALTGRDEFQLRTHLEDAESKADRRVAQALLARLIHVFQHPFDRCLQRKIALLDHILDGEPQAVEQANPTSHSYSKAFNKPVADPAGFEAWLECETARLRQLSVDLVQIGQGTDAVMRVLAAKHAGLSVRVADIDRFLDQGQPTWLRDEDMKVLAQNP